MSFLDPSCQLGKSLSFKNRFTAPCYVFHEVIFYDIKSSSLHYTVKRSIWFENFSIKEFLHTARRTTTRRNFSGRMEN